MALIPLLQGWRRPFSRRLNTLFGNCVRVKERWALDGWPCPGICPKQRVEPILQLPAAGDVVLLQHKWLWSAARGWEAKIEEMKVYEAPKKDCVDINIVMLPGTDKLLSVAKYLSLWRAPKKLALKPKHCNVSIFAPVPEIQIRFANNSGQHEIPAGLALLQRATQSIADGSDNQSKLFDEYYYQILWINVILKLFDRKTSSTQYLRF